MKWPCFVIVVLLAALFPAGAQTPPQADVPAMVDLVEEYVVLSSSQRTELAVILDEALQGFRAIQSAKDPDALKLERMAAVQQHADKRIRDLFSATQYAAYRELLDGGSAPGLAASPAPVTDRIGKLATELGLDEPRAGRFRDLLGELDSNLASIAASGAAGDVAARALLTEILVTDLALIDLLGEEGYAGFFRRRAEGALTGTPVQGSAGLDQVLAFHRLSLALKLSESQRRSVIRQVLDNEAVLAEIRAQHAGNPALLAEKLRLEEQQGLMRLQALLTDEQFRRLLDLPAR